MTELTNELKTIKDVLVYIKDPSLRLTAVRRVRKLLTSNTLQDGPSIDAVIEQGLVPHLVRFLQDFDNDRIQSEAARALSGITAGSSEQTKAVIDAGAIPQLMALLRFNVEKCIDGALAALANIVGNGPEDRDTVLEYGIVNQIILLLEKENLGVQTDRCVARLISNVCRDKNSPPQFNEIKRLLPAMLKLLQSDDAELLSLICWAFAYLTDGALLTRQLVVESGCAARLVQLLDKNEYNIIRPALLAIGNIVRDNDDNSTDLVLNRGFLRHMAKLLNHDRVSIISVAAVALRNIASGKFFLYSSHYIMFQLPFHILTDYIQLQEQKVKFNIF